MQPWPGQQPTSGYGTYGAPQPSQPPTQIPAPPQYPMTTNQPQQTRTMAAPAQPQFGIGGNAGALRQMLQMQQQLTGAQNRLGQAAADAAAKQRAEVQAGAQIKTAQMRADTSAMQIAAQKQMADKAEAAAIEENETQRIHDMKMEEIRGDQERATNEQRHEFDKALNDEEMDRMDKVTRRGDLKEFVDGLLEMRGSAAAEKVTERLAESLAEGEVEKTKLEITHKKQAQARDHAKLAYEREFGEKEDMYLTDERFLQGAEEFRPDMKGLSILQTRDSVAGFGGESVSYTMPETPLESSINKALRENQTTIPIGDFLIENRVKLNTLYDNKGINAKDISNIMLEIMVSRSVLNKHIGNIQGDREEKPLEKEGFSEWGAIAPGVVWPVVPQYTPRQIQTKQKKETYATKEGRQLAQLKYQRTLLGKYQLEVKSFIKDKPELRGGAKIALKIPTESTLDEELLKINQKLLEEGKEIKTSYRRDLLDSSIIDEVVNHPYFGPQLNEFPMLREMLIKNQEDTSSLVV